MSNKSYNLYINFFQEIKFLLEYYNLPQKYNDVKFICDFEKFLMSSKKKGLRMPK